MKIFYMEENKMNQMLKLPIACGVFITRKCDLRCEYCNIPNNEVDKELNIEQWKRAVKILEKNGVKNINFLGGEPTLYDGITELIKYISQNTGMTCSMVTNANDTNKYAIIDKLIDNGLNRISVIVDNLVFDNSISSIKSKSGLALVDYIIKKGHLKKDNFVLRDYCVLNTKNLDNLMEIVDYFDGKGVHLYFLPYHWSAESDYEHRKQIVPLAITQESDLNKLKSQCEKLIELKKRGVLLDNSYEFFESLPKYIEKLNWHCSRLSEIRIDYNGKMMCCCDRKGSVYEEFTIFDLETETNLEKFLLQRQYDSSQCRGCIWPSSFEYEIESKKING